jgi:hypothetical protein
MSWIKLDSSKAQKASSITLSLSLGRSGSAPVLCFSLPSAVAGTAGFDDAEHAAAHLGDGEHEGQMWIHAAPTGAFKIGRLKHCIMIRIPPPAGLALVERSEHVAYQKHPDGGVTFTLPDWAQPARSGETIKAATDKPAALEFNGNTLIMGARELALTKGQASVMQLLARRFGACVTTRQLHDQLYQDDPNGGADDKIIGVWICKIRERLRQGEFPLTIKTHHAQGFALQMAVT